MKQNKITIVIPAYNEKMRLVPTIAEIWAFCHEFPGLIQEVIVIDDGSTDSGKMIESIIYYQSKMSLRIERYTENQGKWFAIRTGLKMATTDAVLIMDADGSAPVWELKKVKKLQEKLATHVAIFGSRFMDASTVLGKTATRTFVSRAYRLFVLVMYWFATSKTDIDDMQAPWKLIYKSKIQGELSINRFAGDVELACKLHCVKESHPLTFIHHSGSTVKLITAIRMALDTLKVCITHKFKKNQTGS